MQQEKIMTLKDHDAIIALQLKGLSLEDAIFNTGYEKGKSEHLSGAVWVKASNRLPKGAGPITWRWLDKEAAYSGFDGIAFIYDKGGARVDMLYAIEIEWLDESESPSKEGNKEAVDVDELWDEHSELIGNGIDDLTYWAGRVIMKKEDFVKAIEQFKNRNNVND